MQVGYMGHKYLQFIVDDQLWDKLSLTEKLSEEFKL